MTALAFGVLCAYSHIQATVVIQNIIDIVCIVNGGIFINIVQHCNGLVHSKFF